MTAATSSPEFLARPDLRKVLALLNRDGEEARVVGGAVRNHLMGLAPSDIDIATTALPDVVLARARTAGIHAVATGYEHGTVTLITGGAAFETTTLREDIDTDGRRAVVRFGRDFRADALRRDFTINALSMSADGTVHDYAGGLADLAVRRVRFIGDAAQRIREDYLRILRFFRFSAAYGGGWLEPEGLAAAIRLRAGLDGLSRERVRQEMMKLFVATDAVPVIASLERSGLLSQVLAGPGHSGRFARMVELEVATGLAASAVRRLMALAVDTAADVERLREGLRLTNAEQRRLHLLLGARASAGDAPRLRLYRLGRDGYRDSLLDLQALDASTSPPDHRAVMQAMQWSDGIEPPRFLLSGKDVLALGVEKGPAVGEALARAEAAWIAAGLPEDDASQRALLAGCLSR